MRITEAFREFGVELTAPQWTTSAITEAPRQVVLSLWQHNFSDDMSHYSASMENRKGGGKHTFLAHLRAAFEERLPIRAVIATASSVELVRTDRAKNAKPDFVPNFELVGRVVVLEGDVFELAFTHIDQLNPASGLSETQLSLAQEGPVDPSLDARVWASQMVAIRQGQAKFRDQLLAAYECKCAISDCVVETVLEAAHINPFRGVHTNRVDNGLLLRSDLHKLFDAGLIWIEPMGTVCLAKDLLDTDYARYRGKELRSPKAPSSRPAPEHLANHADYARDRQKLRT